MAKQLSDLANRGDLISLAQAKFVASFGKVLSPIELQLLKFYILFAMKQHENNLHTLLSMPSLPLWKEMENVKFENDLEQAVSITGREISDMLLKAIQEFDFEKLKQVAKAVWFLKGKAGRKFPSDVKDKESNALIMIKRMTLPLPMTIDQIVGTLEYFTGNKIKKTADGYAVIRRKCKRFGIKIAPSRPTRAK